MDYQTFVDKVVQALPKGSILANPGGGTSTIVSIGGPRIGYRRGTSTMYVAVADLFTTYCKFVGRSVSSTELRAFAPEVFDSKSGGHSCNVTFLFLLLQRIGVIQHIYGSGKRGDPFRVNIPAFGPEMNPALEAMAAEALAEYYSGTCREI